MVLLSAAPALESPRWPVGRHSGTILDVGRQRSLPIDLWYPAVRGTEPLTRYVPLPGIEFESATATDDATVAANDAEPHGRFPLAIVSHGRTGMRYAYSQLAELLAARGFVVVAADHPGDALTDWLGGTFVDDRTNEINRVGDSAILLDVLVGAAADGRRVPSELPAALLDAIDPTRVIAIGHSYGAYTGLAAAAGVRGVAPDQRIAALACLQPYTRTMSDAALTRVGIPTLYAIAEFDATTPAVTDGDRPWQLTRGQPTWRLDVSGAGHHASSDMGLYLELADRVPGLPPMVLAYVAMMRGENAGPQMQPWRASLLAEVRAISAFADIVLGIDPVRGDAETSALASAEGVSLRRR